MVDFPLTLPVKKLDVERPEYTALKSDWSAIDILNEGGSLLRANASRFLVKRPKEASDVYDERCKRITYQNLLGTIVGFYSSKMFRQDPEIDAASNQGLAEFLEDCDRSGHRFVDVFRQVFESLLLYRTCWVLTDKPSADDEPTNRAEEIEAGLDMPFTVIYDPSCVPNWKCDGYGNLEWVWIRLDEPPSTSPFDNEPRLERYWYYFNREQFAVYRWSGDQEKRNDEDNVAQRVRHGEHFLAEKHRVPVRQICVPKSHWLANRVLLQIIDHLNQENSYAWALFLSNLPMPVIIGDWDEKTLTMSEHSLLHLPNPDSSVSWLEPAGTSFQHSADRLGYLREEIYRSVYLQAQGRSSSATPAMQSGYSKEIDLAPANDVLNALGDVLRAGQSNVLEDVSYALGIKKKVTVNGYRFDSGATMAEIETAQAIRDLGINSDTLTKHLDTRVAMAAMDGESKALQEKVAKEIEANPTMAEQNRLNMQEEMSAFEDGIEKPIAA